MGDAVKLSDGCINCRVRIEGTYLGKPWVYVDPPEKRSQFVWPADEFGHRDPSVAWWTEGNMSCDCNRQAFLPAEMRPTEKMACSGETILIDRIVPLDPTLPELSLLESSQGRQ